MKRETTESKSSFQKESSEFPWHHRLPLSTKENSFVLVKKRNGHFDPRNAGFNRQIARSQKYYMWSIMLEGTYTGEELLKEMKALAGTLFMPTVLARCSIKRL